MVSANLSWPDFLVIAFTLIFAILAMRRGFVSVLLALVGFVAGFAVSFALYPQVAQWLSDQFGWSPVWSKPAAFLGVWVLVNSLFSLVSGLVTARLRYVPSVSTANRALAVLPGALEGLLFSAVLLTMLAIMPVQSAARRDIMQSPVGSRLVQATLAVEKPFEGVFGPAARESLGFITITPPTRPGEAPEAGIKLHFTVEDATPDPETEEAMLALVNHERTSQGLDPLEMDAELRLLARAHADDMFKRGYFSHDTPEGKNPFDRMRAANIVFGLAGENLAIAPTLDIAHEGLMNSPGHRANILNPGFHKIGIGVLDGGIYGKMFVQEFTD